MKQKKENEDKVSNKRMPRPRPMRAVIGSPKEEREESSSKRPNNKEPRIVKMRRPRLERVPHNTGAHTLCACVWFVASYQQRTRHTRTEEPEKNIDVY